MSIIFLSDLDPVEVSEWQQLLAAALPDDEIVIWSDDPDAMGDLSAIDIAVVANPRKGLLATLPALRFIHSAWAGVDALLTDKTLPSIPIARLIDPTLAADMAEGVLTHVMAVHRQAPAYAASQRASDWAPLVQPRAGQRRVGILGMGEMGAASAMMLEKIGFQVAGWSRSGRSAATGIEMFSGEDGLAALLARSEILVNLLPLTAETSGILNRETLALLPKGASLVNVGRGGHLVVADLLDALDSGHLKHAVLDVFTVEPLPAEDPLWARQDVTITPHVAAATYPVTASREIAANIARFRDGGEVVGIVERSNGY